MTDYFALLEQARHAWLDPEELKATFHAKTLRAHPDAQAERGAESQAGFAELNEAYQVLRDPKRRLHHLLTLQGTPPSARQSSVPAEIEALFPAVAGVTVRADGLVQQAGTAASALRRSLLKPQLLAVTKEIEEILSKLRELERAAQAKLKEASRSNESNELQALYLRFSYLTNWIGQLEEKLLQLTP